MARGNIPSHLVPLVGKKNWTKSELEEKKRREVILDGESIRPSEHLPTNLHDRFYWFVNEFEGLGILANVDSDAISRYIMADEKYWEVTEYVEGMDVDDPDFNKITNIQKRYFDQSTTLAKELGLTFKSRMGLKKPDDQDDKPQSDEEKLFGKALGQ